MINADGATHSLYDSNRAHEHGQLLRRHDEVPGERDRPAAAATAGASTSTATSRSARSSTASRARRPRAARAATTPARSSSPSPRPATRSGCRPRSRTSSSSNNIHSSGGYFMWPPGSYTPARVPLPYPPYGTLNFFDQTATHVLDGHQVPPRHGDPAAADRPGDRRALLGRRQLRRRGVVQERHHRLRLRDRRHPLQRHGRPARRPATRVSSRRSAPTRPTTACQRGQRRGRGVRHRQLRPPAVRAGLPERHRGRRSSARASTADGKAPPTR